MRVSEEQTVADFAEWFKRYPTLKNPTDLNTEEKFSYAVEIGWERHRAMEQARKNGAKFCKKEYLPLFA